MRMTARAALAGSLVLAALLPAPADAQQYPTRPIRWIVPYPPGGAVDVVTRKMAAKLPLDEMKKDASLAFLQTFLMVPTYALVRFGKWDEILAEPKPGYDGAYSLEVMRPAYRAREIGEYMADARAKVETVLQNAKRKT